MCRLLEMGHECERDKVEVRAKGVRYKDFRFHFA